MKPFAKGLVPIGFVGFWLAAASAHAVAPRAYVSVDGSDANTCSNPGTPCRTFTGAVAQTTPGGEVVVLNSGTFGGGTISQAVTINAPAGVAALAATPITINAGSSDVVTLRGITFVSPTPGAGTALTFSGGAGLNIENCVFHGWNNALAFTVAGNLNVADTTLRDNFNGIYLYANPGPIHASIDRTRFLGNGNIGLHVASNGATVTVRKSFAAGNYVGFFASSNGAAVAELNIENCVATHNSYGVFADSAGGGFGRIRIANSTIANNLTGLFQVNSGVIVSRVDNTVEGNGTETSGTIGTFAAK